MRIFDVEYRFYPRGARHGNRWSEMDCDEMDFEVVDGEPDSMFSELIEQFNDYCDRNGYVARIIGITDITEAA